MAIDEEKLRTEGNLYDANKLLLEIFKSRHWPEEGQMWGFLIEEGTLDRLEDYMGLAETAERMGLK